MANPGCFLSTLALVILTLDVALAAKSTPRTNVEISCNLVTQQLTPCLTYMTDKDPKPSTNCCNGAKQMADTAKTTGDRQTVCQCIKTALAEISGVDYANINQIPKICGVQVTLPPIDKDTDCKSIQLKDLLA